MRTSGGGSLSAFPARRTGSGGRIICNTGTEAGARATMPGFHRWSYPRRCICTITVEFVGRRDTENLPYEMEIKDAFRPPRVISPWVDASRRNWGSAIWNFLICGYADLGNGGGTLSARFSSIRFLHLIECRGDYGGEECRSRDLADEAKRGNWHDQQIPAGGPGNVEEREDTSQHSIHNRPRTLGCIDGRFPLFHSDWGSQKSRR